MPGCVGRGPLLAAVFAVWLMPVAALVAPLPAAAEEGEAAGPVYVRLMPISFTVIGSDNRIAREVSILLTLELGDGKNSQSLDPYSHQIQDAFFTALTELWDSHPASGPPVQIDEIKGKLLAIANGIAGAGMVQTILVQGISERGR